jgi:hypothetical protein
MIGFNLGLASGLYVLLGETVPIRIKNEANAVLNLMRAGFTSLTMVMYQYMTTAIDGSGTFLFFSTCCFVVLGYTIYGLPETKGQSLRMIERRMTATSLNIPDELVNGGEKDCGREPEENGQADDKSMDGEAKRPSWVIGDTIYPEGKSAPNPPIK